MKRVLCILAAFAALYPVALRGQSLIIAGGGFVGVWDTEIDIANPSGIPSDITLSIRGIPSLGPCNCAGPVTYTLPANGTIRVLASDFLGGPYAGPQMIRLDQVPVVGDGPQPALPIVHARAVSQASSCQFAELPVTREETLQALNPSALAFPGASRLAGVYSNLILEFVGGSGGPGEALLELFDRDGVSRGSATISVAGEMTVQATTVVDIVGFLGVAELDGGQMRVTKTSGDGVLWGVLTTVGAEGSLRVSVGANP